MADLIYRGCPPVGADNTQALLAGSFGAIWTPPMYRRATASSGDRVWLIWQADRQTALFLGRGRVLFTEAGGAAWTNRTAPGIVSAARRYGYRGPTNMAFLRFRDIVIAHDRPPVRGLEGVPVGLSAANSQQVMLLEALFSIGCKRPNDALHVTSGAGKLDAART